MILKILLNNQAILIIVMKILMSEIQIKKLKILIALNDMTANMQSNKIFNQ